MPVSGSAPVNLKTGKNERSSGHLRQTYQWNVIQIERPLNLRISQASNNIFGRFTETNQSLVMREIG